MKVTLHKDAERDVRRLILFLEGKSPRAAAKLGSVLEKGFQRLSAHPRIGRPTVTGEARLLTVGTRRASYVMRYAITSRGVLILRIWHGKEDRPQE